MDGYTDMDEYITERPDWADETLRTYRSETTREGIHVSDLVFCLRKSYFRKRGEYPAEEDAMILARLAGKAHHGFLEGSGLPGGGPAGAEQPAVARTEAERHTVTGSEVRAEFMGVFATADQVYQGPEGRVVREIKTTRSTRALPYDNDHWLVQLKAYMLIFGADLGRLDIFYLVGAPGESGPALRSYEVRVSREKLIENWDRLLMRRQILADALERGEPPPFDYKYDWECRFCPMRALEPCRSDLAEVWAPDLRRDRSLRRKPMKGR